jgi:hypothetical protein
MFEATLYLLLGSISILSLFESGEKIYVLYHFPFRVGIIVKP